MKRKSQPQVPFELKMKQRHHHDPMMSVGVSLRFEIKWNQVHNWRHGTGPLLSSSTNSMSQWAALLSTEVEKTKQLDAQARQGERTDFLTQKES